MLLYFFLLAFIVDFSADQSLDSYVKEYTTHIEFKSNKRTTKTKVLIQINSKHGEWLGKVQIPYEKGNNIKNLEARILDETGNIIRELKKRDIVDRNEREEEYSYGDGMVKEFHLIHNEFPYFIEYSFIEDDNEFIYSKWFANYKNQNTVRAELILEFPLSYELNFESNLIQSEPQVSQSSESKIFKWVVENCDRVEEESYGPDWTELSPSVTIFPSEFYYGLKGNSTNWTTYGNWVYQLGEDCNDFGQEEIKQFKSFTKGISDQKEIIQVLYNRLQDEMRYVNVSLGVGGMKPYPASYVSEKKYGDCKALTYYMKSTLELFDIASYPVDVYWSAQPRKIDKNIPTQQFNHVFLCIPLNGDTIWLENTSKVYPFNYLDLNKRGQYGLFIDKDASQLIELPKSSLADITDNTKIEIHPKSDLTLNAILKSEFRSDWFETLRYINKQWTRSEQDSWLRKNFFVPSSTLGAWKIKSNERNAKSIAFEAKFTIDNYMKKYGSNFLVFIPKSELPDLEEPDNRQYELRIQNPIHRIDTLNYYLTDIFYTKIKLPETKSIDADGGSYSLEFVKGQNQIQVIKKLLIKANTSQPGEGYNKFYSFLKDIEAIESKTYIQLIQ